MGLSAIQETTKQESDLLNAAHHKGELCQTFKCGTLADDTPELDNTVNFSDWLSIQKIEHAEHSLGHALDNRPKIENAHIAHNDNNIRYLFDHKIAPYSVDDTITEQNTEKSDADTTTAGGYLKRQICDPSAHEKNVAKKRQADWTNINTVESLLQQVRLQIAQLEQEIEALDEHIEQLDIEIKDKQAELAASNEIAEFIGDGGNVKNLSSAKQRRLNQMLATQGKKVDDYKKADGSIDNDAMAEDLKKVTDQQLEEIEALETEKAEAEAERQEKVRELEQAKLQRDELIQNSSNEAPHDAYTAKADQDPDELLKSFDLDNLLMGDDLFADEETQKQEKDDTALETEVATQSTLVTTAMAS